MTTLLLVLLLGIEYRFCPLDWVDNIHVLHDAS
jgi:hypothetical protein